MEFIKKKILRYEYIGFVLILIFFIFFNFLSKVNEAARLGMRIRRERSAVQTVTKEERARQVQQLEMKLKQIDKASAYIRQEVEKFKASIPENMNAPILTLEIEDLAGASRIELASVKPLPGEDNGDLDYEVLPIEIGFQSTYSRLVDFIEALERSSELMSVQKLNIQKDEMAYPLLDVRLTISVLLNKEEVSSGEESIVPEAEGIDE